MSSKAAIASGMKSRQAVKNSTPATSRVAAGGRAGILEDASADSSSMADTEHTCAHIRISFECSLIILRGSELSAVRSCSIFFHRAPMKKKTAMLYYFERAVLGTWMSISMWIEQMKSSPLSISVADKETPPAAPIYRVIHREEEEEDTPTDPPITVRVDTVADAAESV